MGMKKHNAQNEPARQSSETEESNVSTIDNTDVNASTIDNTDANSDSKIEFENVTNDDVGDVKGSGSEYSDD
jgi:hypothetical protein